MKIVTLTMNPSVDQVSEVDRMEPDRKLRASQCRYEPGGGGLNVLRAIRRLISVGRPTSWSNGADVIDCAPPSAAANTPVVLRSRLT